MATRQASPGAPPQRIIAADPVWDLAREFQDQAELARSLKDERFADVLDQVARRITTAVAAGAELQDVSTADAAPVLGILPESVATACRRGRIPGARKIAGEWRIPVRTLDRGQAA